MKDKDLKIIYTRGSGPGGQHKNKVETCVVITHIPTGLSVRCQETRYKSRNLTIAKDLLKKKIEKQEKEETRVKNNERRLELIKNFKVVRTYNYTRNEVIDHRRNTKHELKKFMKGEIDL